MIRLSEVNRDACREVCGIEEKEKGAGITKQLLYRYTCCNKDNLVLVCCHSINLSYCI